MPCCTGVFVFWGSYSRTQLPDKLPVWIPRIRCKGCLVTHAVLPAFLFGYVRYTTRTLSVYLEQAAENSLPPIESWRQDLADGPENSETLYRWFSRLRPRLATLLPLLKSELLSLNPAFDLAPLQEIILKFEFKKSSLQKDDDYSASVGPSQSTAGVSPPAMFSIVALCAISYWLGQNVLQLAGELLQAESALSPVALLNYYCWQKTGSALLSPKERSRPP